MVVGGQRWKRKQRVIDALLFDEVPSSAGVVVLVNNPGPLFVAVKPHLACSMAGIRSVFQEWR